MNVGLFSGTFDPIHRGHLALAQAAQERFDLGRIYFAPTGNPPHKQKQPLAGFGHRYAMVVLATMGEKTFVPSLLEAPESSVPASVGVKKTAATPQTLKKADRLFFLIGIDAFNDIAKWHQAEALFRECPFIVASRPGYSLADVANALPERLRPKAAVTKPFVKQPAKGDLVLAGVTVHLLDGVQQSVSATAIREAVSGKRSLAKFVDPAVGEYIGKTGLYQSGRP
jgi:nicotinate-nucleotide adenylyltransferase